jgi:hypothetical protein
MGENKWRPFPAEPWETLGSGIIADLSGGIFRQEKRKSPFRNLSGIRKRKSHG